MGVKVNRYPFQLTQLTMIQVLNENPNRISLDVYFNRVGPSGFEQLIYGVYFGDTGYTAATWDGVAAANTVRFQINNHYQNPQLSSVFPVPLSSVTICHPEASGFTLFGVLVERTR